MMVDSKDVLAYSSYLALNEILSSQRPRSDEHDEMLFIIVHQAHELWFKQVLHELAALQLDLAAGDTVSALHKLHRIPGVFKVVVSHIDVLETMTPIQFSAFREKLRGSGFYSAQFREIEAVLGHRDDRVFLRYPEHSAERRRIRAAMLRPSVFDSFLGYLAACGYAVPHAALRRDVSAPLEPSAEVQEILLRVYHDDGPAAQICERLVDIDEGMQEWRYRHVAMVKRIIGDKRGTGGSTGVSFLRTGLLQAMFPDLWALRGRL